MKLHVISKKNQTGLQLSGDHWPLPSDGHDMDNGIRHILRRRIRAYMGYYRHSQHLVWAHHLRDIHLQESSLATAVGEVQVL